MLTRCLCCNCVYEDDDLGGTDYDQDGLSSVHWYNTGSGTLYVGGNSEITSRIASPTVTGTYVGGAYAQIDVKFTTASDSFTLYIHDDGSAGCRVTPGATDGTLDFRYLAASSGTATITGLTTGRWCRLCLSYSKTSATSQNVTVTAHVAGHGSVATITKSTGTLGMATGFVTDNRKCTFQSITSTRIDIRRFLYSKDHSEDSSCQQCDTCEPQTSGLSGNVIATFNILSNQTADLTPYSGNGVGTANCKWRILGGFNLVRYSGNIDVNGKLTGLPSQIQGTDVGSGTYYNTGEFYALCQSCPDSCDGLYYWPDGGPSPTT